MPRYRTQRLLEFWDKREGGINSSSQASIVWRSESKSQVGYLSLEHASSGTNWKFWLAETIESTRTNSDVLCLCVPPHQQSSVSAHAVRRYCHLSPLMMYTLFTVEDVSLVLTQPMRVWRWAPHHPLHLVSWVWQLCSPWRTFSFTLSCKHRSQSLSKFSTAIQMHKMSLQGTPYQIPYTVMQQ